MCGLIPWLRASRFDGRILITAAGLLIACSAQGAIFVPLGDLPGGASYSRAHAVSADGRVVVGESESTSGTEAFCWQAGTLGGLGDLPGGGFYSAAFAISADGSVIVGQAFAGQGSETWFEAFRWEGGAMNGLGFLPGVGISSKATGVSADGSVIVGSGSLSGLGQRAFRWEDGTMVPISAPPGAIATTATGVSADGRVISGYVQFGGQAFATQWNDDLPILLAGLNSSHDTVARGISADGKVVVGDSGFSGGTEAVSWKSGQLTPLGDLVGGQFFSVALAASHDGSVIVGRGASESGFEAFIWSEPTGILNLREVLIAQGVSNLDGWTLEQAEGLSANGRVIVGWGRNPQGFSEAWLIDLDAQPNDVVPEPSAMIVWLVGLGIGGLSFWSKRVRG